MAPSRRSPTGTRCRSRSRTGRAPSCASCSALRDAVTGLLEAEAASLDDTPELEVLRRDLNIRYDTYLRAYGPVNRFSWRHTGRTDPGTGEEKLARIRPPQGGFRSDPFAPLVQALEEFDPVSQTAAKAAIFTGRVVAPRNPRLGADTPADALAICLDVCGEVQLAGIARLLGTDEDQARSGTRHPGLRRPRIRPAGARRGVPVRPGPRQAGGRRAGRRRRSPLRGQRRRNCARSSRPI